MRCCSAPLCSVFWRGSCDPFRCPTQLAVLRRHKSVSSIPSWETSLLFPRSVGRMREGANEPRSPLFKSEEPSSSARSVIKDFVTNFAAEQSRCCAGTGCFSPGCPRAVGPLVGTAFSPFVFCRRSKRGWAVRPSERLEALCCLYLPLRGAEM